MAAKTAVEESGKKLSRSDKALARQLCERMADSLLPGEAALPEDHLAEAAEFLLEAALQRKAGESAILMRTAAAGRRFMRVAVVNDDMPFLVDSVAAAIAEHGLAIDVMVHPIVPVRRDGSGKLSALPEDENGDAKRESMIYIETARADARERRALEKALASTLGDVGAAVADWPKMVELMEGDAERLDDGEGAALLRWLAGGMLTLLGHVTRKRDGSRAQMLGICRKSTRDLLAEDSYQRAFAWFDESPGARSDGRGRAPLIIKANRQSQVHRRVPLDLFIVPLEENGRVEALSIHAGIWTSAALATPPSEVPVLRRQLTAALERFDFTPGSHDAKSQCVTLGGTNPTNGEGGKRHPTLKDNVIIGSGAQIIGPITVGERARVGANAVVTEDVPEGATMVGLKARSTLVPAETWLREFIPYGTPCDEPCEPSTQRIDELEARLAQLQSELERMRGSDGETSGPRKRSGSGS